MTTALPSYADIFFLNNTLPSRCSLRLAQKVLSNLMSAIFHQRVKIVFA